MVGRVATGRPTRKGLFVAGALAACTPAIPIVPNSPRQTAERHVAAARMGDASALQATLHPTVGTSPALTKAAEVPGYATRPELVVLDGELRFDCGAGGPCRLTSPLPRFDQRDSPDAALALLARALRAGDAEALRELAPARLRATLTDRQLVTRLNEGASRDAWLAAVTQLESGGQWLRDGEAFVRRVSPGHEASFAREPDGAWVLVDLR